MPWTAPSTLDRPVTVLGAGVLGRRIAAAWAAGGYAVNIRDPNPEQLTAASEYVKSNLWRYPGHSADQIPSVRTFQDLEPAVQGAFLVIECAPEKLEIKQQTFGELENLAPSDAILASNSSSYKSRETASELQVETRRRVLNMHYMMPPVNKIVELMTCGDTQEEIFPFLVEKLKDIGMLPVIAHKESTGFVINRVWAAIKRECLTVLAEGVSTPEELDAVWTEMFVKTGATPCASMDAVGLDTVSFIEKHYIEERGLKDPGVIPYLQKYIDEGKLGAKSSLGGLYPPGYTTKTAGQQQGDHDNVHAPELYFLDVGLANKPEDVFSSGRILVGSADGKSPLRTIVEHQNLPDGIALSRSEGLILWTNMAVPDKNDGHVMSCNMDGSDVKTIVPHGAVHTPKQMALDEVNKKVYIADREGMRILRCNFDGSALETLIQTGDWTHGFEDQTKWCVGIAVAPERGTFYWTQKGPSKASKGQIFRASIEFPTGTDASSRTDIERLFNNLPEPIDLEVDEEGGFLYWTDRGEMPLGNSLNRAPLETVGTGKYDILARNLHEAIGLALDKKNQHIYATDLGGSVYRFNMDGSNKKRFYDDQGSFTGIALSHV
ncbi:hypothetical protein JX265_002120 [Neoarthrinium moseri]|uniref:Uncharacterized protein n=1 Tax=Neoarthrinium moseri TaxID=1658444 RepID=A0A9P9WU21_9PEZI|nr:hypothetical protein JX265_002120 [Neoarthrinium moseri]